MQYSILFNQSETKKIIVNKKLKLNTFYHCLKFLDQKMITFPTCSRKFTQNSEILNKCAFRGYRLRKFQINVKLNINFRFHVVN